MPAGAVAKFLTPSGSEPLAIAFVQPARPTRGRRVVPIVEQRFIVSGTYVGPEPVYPLSSSEDGMNRKTSTLAGTPRFVTSSVPRIRDGLLDGLTPIERAMAEKLLSRTPQQRA